jgi:RNA polymerase sigma factor (sigma-70 family)
VASETLGRFLWHIRQVHGASQASDAQLLERFASRREEQAFVALVRRHGPLVLGVCRRVLRDDHESEDAFQATFLALARQASSIRRGECLSSWLYGVALRVALRARAELARRRQHERKAAQKGNGASRETFPLELRLVLDEELGRLPARYRGALVLCYLQGKTHIEAARELGYPPGSMSRHLARARELLRARLVRRGIVLSTALLGVELATLTARAALPSTLVGGTVRACTAFAIYQGASTISTKVLALADGALKSMFIVHLKMAAVVVIAVCALGAGAGAFLHHAITPQAIADNQAPPSANENPSLEQEPPPPNSEPTPKPPASKENIAPEPDVWERRLVELRAQLGQSITVEFDKMPLDDAISFLGPRYNLPIVYLSDAFKEEDELDEFRKRPIQLQKLAGFELRTVLRMLLERANADYQLREGGLFIFPKEYAASGRLLQQPVTVSFRQVSLDQALARVAAKTGVSVVLDARAARDAKIAITADLDNVPLETAVRILADMAALKPVALGNTFYVTTIANARMLEAERTASSPPHPISAPKKAKEDPPKTSASKG